MKYRFYSDCVSWPRNQVNELCECIDDAIDISRKTFLKHVDRVEQESIERSLEYAGHWKQGLTAAADWGIRYQRSKLNGTRVYMFVQSGIEYIFVPKEMRGALYA